MKIQRDVNAEILQEKKNERIKFLKSLIFPAVLVVVIAVLVICVMKYQDTIEGYVNPAMYSNELAEDPIVLENAYLVFTMDPLTTTFEVKSKSTGAVWTSNPSFDDCDAGASQDDIRDQLKSTFLMTTMTDVGKLQTYTSYGSSVARTNYNVIKGDDYIQVDYTFGNTEKKFRIPTLLTQSEYDDWLSKLSEKGQKNLKNYYKKYDQNKLAKLTKTTDIETRDKLFADYPIVVEQADVYSVFYLLRDTCTVEFKKSMEKYFAEAGYTDEMYKHDVEVASGSSTSEVKTFNASFKYYLDEQDLMCELDLSSIELPENTDEFVNSIAILPNFGAGSKDEEGFMLVPEGSGAIINFNNGKTSLPTYVSNMYGRDFCLKTSELVHSTNASFNTFGISKNDSSFLCIMEDGSAFASIKSDIGGAGKTSMFNNVYAEYVIQQSQLFDVGAISNTTVYRFSDIDDQLKIKQRYKFINSGSYVDMAKEYGTYMREKYGIYLKLLEDDCAPVVVEIVGAVDKVKQILGVPVSKPLELTTYEQAGKIIQSLYDDGLTNMSVKFSGWCNGGVQQRVLEHIKPVSELGSKKDFKELVQLTNDLGINFYLDGITQYAYDDRMFDGFFSYTDAAKFISRERAELFPFSHITYAARESADSYYLLHTEMAMEMAENLVSAADKYNTGVSFQDIGSDLSSDFYRKNYYSRDKVKNMQAEFLKEVDSKGMPIMINAGNDYALPYADVVTNMDLRGNDYTILDECIPFLQLALHGRVNYTGMPLNICGDTDTELLYAAEYGAGLYFTVMNEDSFALQNTLYTEYYGSTFKEWHDDLLTIYLRYNRELGHTFNQEMTDHKNITSQVSCTSYKDGTKVYVNYGYTDYFLEDGTKVSSRNYKVIK